MRRAINVGFALAVAIGGAASAEPIVYSIHGDADGELDGRAFSGAQFRLELRSDTVHTVTAIENGVTVYRNDQGHAILFLTRGAQTTVAHIAPNQIFVRYDPTNGVVGFGTHGIGPFYPVSLDWCGLPMGCGAIETGTPEITIVGALAQLKVAPHDSVFYPAAVEALATELRGRALLGGFLDACVSYDVINLRCPSIPGTPIKTDQGDLYFQKQTLFGKGVFTATVGRVGW